MFYIIIVGCIETVSECPEGMVYQECGIACPTTCDNKDILVRPCTLQCVQGEPRKSY